MRAQEILSEAWPFRNKAAVYDLLLDNVGSGPFDGGCVVFAQALEIKFGGDIVVLVGRNTPNSMSVAQHAALQLNNTLVDADGAAEPQRFVQRFLHHEMPFGDISEIRPITDQDLPDASRDLQLAAEIAELL